MREAGAQLIVSDIDKVRSTDIGERFNAKVVEPDEIYGVHCDIFACAMEP